jgi:hypothetical protein
MNAPTPQTAQYADLLEAQLNEMHAIVVKLADEATTYQQSQELQRDLLAVTSAAVVLIGRAQIAVDRAQAGGHNVAVPPFEKAGD